METLQPYTLMLMPGASHFLEASRSSWWLCMFCCLKQCSWGRKLWNLCARAQGVSASARGRSLKSSNHLLMDMHKHCYFTYGHAQAVYTRALCAAPSYTEYVCTTQLVPHLQGESVGMVLHFVGGRPVKEGTGRIARFELIPLEMSEVFQVFWQMDECKPCLTFTSALQQKCTL
eukprot:scaffold119813_cov17-Tisochrysis_lutea.AAC.2